MDPRIGILTNGGNPIYYAFVDGYHMPEFRGTLEQVENKLGIRQLESKKIRVKRTFIVTLVWKGGSDEEIELEAFSHSDAVSRARQWKNLEYGRARACNTLPCTFRVRLSVD